MTIDTNNFQPQMGEIRNQLTELVQQYADTACTPNASVQGETAVSVMGKTIGDESITEQLFLV